MSFLLRPDWRVAIPRPKLCGLGAGVVLVGSEQRLACFELDAGDVRWQRALEGLPWSGVIPPGSNLARVELREEVHVSREGFSSVSFVPTSRLDVDLAAGETLRRTEAGGEDGETALSEQAEGETGPRVEVEDDDDGTWLVCLEEDGAVRFRVHAVCEGSPQVALSAPWAFAWDEDRISVFDGTTGTCLGEVGHPAARSEHVYVGTSHLVVVDGWGPGSVQAISLAALVQQACPTLRSTLLYEELPSRSVQMLAVLVAEARLEDGRELHAPEHRACLEDAGALVEEKKRWLLSDDDDDRALLAARDTLDQSWRALQERAPPPEEDLEVVVEIGSDVLELVETSKPAAWEAVARIGDPAVELQRWRHAVELTAPRSKDRT